MQGSWIFAISPACPWRRRIADNQGTLRVALWGVAGTPSIFSVIERRPQTASPTAWPIPLPVLFHSLVILLALRT
jgi:hypothetical protein